MKDLPPAGSGTPTTASTTSTKLVNNNASHCNIYANGPTGVFTNYRNTLANHTGSVPLTPNNIAPCSPRFQSHSPDLSVDRRYHRYHPQPSTSHSSFGMASGAMTPSVAPLKFQQQPTKATVLSGTGVELSNSNKTGQSRKFSSGSFSGPSSSNKTGGSGVFGSTPVARSILAAVKNKAKKVSSPSVPASSSSSKQNQVKAAGIVSSNSSSHLEKHSGQAYSDDEDQRHTDESTRGFWRNGKRGPRSGSAGCQSPGTRRSNSSVAGGSSRIGDSAQPLVNGQADYEEVTKGATIANSQSSGRRRLRLDIKFGRSSAAPTDAAAASSSQSGSSATTSALGRLSAGSGVPEPAIIIPHANSTNRRLSSNPSQPQSIAESKYPYGALSNTTQQRLRKQQQQQQQQQHQQSTPNESATTFTPTIDPAEMATHRDHSTRYSHSSHQAVLAKVAASKERMPLAQLREQASARSNQRSSLYNEHHQQEEDAILTEHDEEHNLIAFCSAMLQVSPSNAPNMQQSSQCQLHEHHHEHDPYSSSTIIQPQFTRRPALDNRSEDLRGGTKLNVGQGGAFTSYATCFHRPAAASNQIQSSDLTVMSGRSALSASSRTTATLHSSPQRQLGTLAAARDPSNPGDIRMPVSAAPPVATGSTTILILEEIVEEDSNVSDSPPKLEFADNNRENKTMAGADMCSQEPSTSCSNNNSSFEQKNIDTTSNIPFVNDDTHGLAIQCSFSQDSIGGSQVDPLNIRANSDRSLLHNNIDTTTRNSFHHDRITTIGVGKTKFEKDKRHSFSPQVPHKTLTPLTRTGSDSCALESGSMGHPPSNVNHSNSLNRKSQPRQQQCAQPVDSIFPASNYIDHSEPTCSHLADQQWQHQAEHHELHTISQQSWCHSQRSCQPIVAGGGDSDATRNYDSNYTFPPPPMIAGAPPSGLNVQRTTVETTAATSTAMSATSSVNYAAAGLRLRNRVCTSYRIEVPSLKNPVDACLLPNSYLAIADYDNGIFILNPLGDIVEHKSSPDDRNACGIACACGPIEPRPQPGNDSTLNTARDPSEPKYDDPTTAGGYCCLTLYVLVFNEGLWTINIYENYYLQESIRCPSDPAIESWALRKIGISPASGCLHLMASGEFKVTIWLYEFTTRTWRVLATENSRKGGYNDISIRCERSANTLHCLLTDWRKSQLATVTFSLDTLELVNQRSIRVKRHKGQEWIVQGPNLALMDEQADIIVYDGSGKLFLFDGDSYRCKKIIADVGRGEVSAVFVRNGWVYVLCRYRLCIDVFLYKEFLETIL